MKSHKKQATKVDWGFTRYVPLDESEYPRQFEQYHRFYVRSRFIVYAEYYASGEVKGFMLIWYTNARQSLIIERAPFVSMYSRVMLWCDQHENDQTFKIVAKIN